MYVKDWKMVTYQTSAISLWNTECQPWSLHHLLMLGCSLNESPMFAGPVTGWERWPRLKTGQGCGEIWSELSWAPACAYLPSAACPAGGSFPSHLCLCGIAVGHEWDPHVTGSAGSPPPLPHFDLKKSFNALNNIVHFFMQKHTNHGSDIFKCRNFHYFFLVIILRYFCGIDLLLGIMKEVKSSVHRENGNRG